MDTTALEAGEPGPADAEPSSRQARLWSAAALRVIVREIGRATAGPS